MSKIALALLATMTATSAPAEYIWKGFEPQIGVRHSYIASEAVLRPYLRKNETGEPIANARGRWLDGAGFVATGNWTDATKKTLRVKLGNTLDRTEWLGIAAQDDPIGLIMRLQPNNDRVRFVRCSPTELY